MQGGGESLEQLCVRVQNAFEQIASGSLGELLSTHLRVVFNTTLPRCSLVYD